MGTYAGHCSEHKEEMIYDALNMGFLFITYGDFHCNNILSVTGNAGFCPAV